MGSLRVKRKTSGFLNLGVILLVIFLMVRIWGVGMLLASRGEKVWVAAKHSTTQYNSP